MDVQPMPTSGAPAREGRALPRMAYQVLLVLAGGANHGYAIAKEIERNSAGRTRAGTGSLYLSMSKLKQAGLIEICGPPASESRRDARRRYYRLTDEGRHVAVAESARLVRLLQLARSRRLLDERALGPLLAGQTAGSES